MSQLKSIIIITPNSDTFTNPTMIALFQLLKEEKLMIYLVGPTQHLSCPADFRNLKMVNINLKLFVWKNPKHIFSQLISYYKIYQLIKKQKVKTVLAVDPLALIWAGRVKRFFASKIHLSYLSFEIFFKEELAGYYLKLKQKEIYYSSLINSLLTQDETRKNLLIEENHLNIDESKIALVPVSPMEIQVKEIPDLHQHLSIHYQKKMAVYSGSVGEWCGTHAIIEAFDKKYWDESYHLVFHTRTEITKENPFYEDLNRLHADEHIPFSLHLHPFDTFEELSVFLSGFDLALALYYPNNENPYYGKNMKEIGLSSGKFSTYMMLALPTIVTSCSVYEELIQKYAFGAVIQNIQDLKKATNIIENAPNDSLKLYQEVLNPKISIFNYYQLLQ